MARAPRKRRERRLVQKEDVDIVQLLKDLLVSRCSD